MKKITLMSIVIMFVFQPISTYALAGESLETEISSPTSVSTIPAVVEDKIKRRPEMRQGFTPARSGALMESPISPVETIPEVTKTEEKNAAATAEPDQGTSAGDMDEGTSSALITGVGDYNLDGKVDDADRLVWRAHFGLAVTPGTSADGNNNGIIDTADYVVWRNNRNQMATVTQLHQSVFGEGQLTIERVVYSSDVQATAATVRANGEVLGQYLIQGFQDQGVSPSGHHIVNINTIDGKTVTFDNWEHTIFDEASISVLENINSPIYGVAAKVTKRTFTGVGAAFGLSSKHLIWSTGGSSSGSVVEDVSGKRTATVSHPAFSQSFTSSRQAGSNIDKVTYSPLNLQQVNFTNLQHLYEPFTGVVIGFTAIDGAGSAIRVEFRTAMGIAAGAAILE